MENNKHYSEQTGHRLRGLFAKRQRELPHVLTDLEITQKFPEVYGVVTKPDEVVNNVVNQGFNHISEIGEALIVPGVNCGEEEAAQLRERGATFPLETAEPSRVKFVREADIFGQVIKGLSEPLNEFPRPIKPTDI